MPPSTAFVHTPSSSIPGLEDDVVGLDSFVAWPKGARYSRSTICSGWRNSCARWATAV